MKLKQCFSTFFASNDIFLLGYDTAMTSLILLSYSKVKARLTREWDSLERTKKKTKMITQFISTVAGSSYFGFFSGGSLSISGMKQNWFLHSSTHHIGERREVERREVGRREEVEEGGGEEGGWEEVEEGGGEEGGWEEVEEGGGEEGGWEEVEEGGGEEGGWEEVEEGGGKEGGGEEGGEEEGGGEEGGKEEGGGEEGGGKEGGGEGGRWGGRRR